MDEAIGVAHTGQPSSVAAILKHDFHLKHTDKVQRPPLNNFFKSSTFCPNVLSQHLKDYSLRTDTISGKQRNHLLGLVNVTAKHVTIIFLSVAII